MRAILFLLTVATVATVVVIVWLIVLAARGELHCPAGEHMVPMGKGWICVDD